MANPTETALTAAEVTAKSASTDTNTGIIAPTIGQTGYQTTTFDDLAKTERMLAGVNGLRVVKVGTGTNCGVWSGSFMHDGAAVAYAGAATQALTNNDTNYVYLTAAGTLTVNITGFPSAAHVPLATVAVGTESAAAVSGAYNHVDIVDYRPRSIFRTVGQAELRSVKIPFQNLRNDDFSVMDATGGAGLFSFTDGGFGTGTMTVDGEAASGNSKTDTLQFEYVLPANYVASADVKMVVAAIESVGAATDSTTISAEVYESDGNGGVSADLAASWVSADVTDSWGDKTLTITDAGLVAGDKLRVYIRIVTNDTGGAIGTIAQIGEITMQHDCYQDF